jgi:transposase
MVLLAADGLGNDQIAVRLDCGRDVVSQWRKRFFEHRLAGLDDLPRRGRPPTFSPSGSG